ncbi:MAG: YlxR family protein [Clostridia bacterium]|nr:YlxR family protein [Clostridia bacterium]
MNKIPQRSCTICRAQKNKNELLRIVKNKDNEIKVDIKGKESGRGAYICYNMECYEKAKKSKRLEKVFETNIEEEKYNQMKEAIENKIGGDVIG